MKAKRAFIAGRLFLLMGLFSSLIACSGYDTMSNEVRPGGWIMIAVGPVNNEVIEPADLTVNMVDSASVAFSDLTVRELLRVNPDPLSQFGYGGEGSNGPYPGQLLAVVEIPHSSDPTPEDPEPATGEAFITLTNPATNWVSEHGFQILPYSSLSTPPENPLYSYDAANEVAQTIPWLAYTRPSPHVLIETTADTSFDAQNVTVAGVSFRLRFNNVDFALYSLDGSTLFRVTKLSPDPNLQLAWRAQDNGNGTSDLIITLSNPRGFYPPGVKHFFPPSKSVFRDLSTVAIVWKDGDYLGNAQNPFEWVGAQGYSYYDINGNEVVGLTADMPL